MELLPYVWMRLKDFNMLYMWLLNQTLTHRVFLLQWIINLICNIWTSEQRWHRFANTHTVCALYETSFSFHFCMLFLERSSKESGNHAKMSHTFTVVLCNKSYQCSNIWVLKIVKLFTISNLPDYICFVVTQIKYFKTCLFQSVIKKIWRGARIVFRGNVAWPCIPTISSCKRKKSKIFTTQATLHLSLAMVN